MNPAHPWLEHLVDQLDVAVLIVGSGSAISYATPAAERMLGAASGALAGMTMDQLLPVERRGELKNFEDVLSGGSGRRLRSALRLSDGRRIDVSLTLSPLLDDQGRVAAVSARYEPARSSAQWVRASLTPPRPSMPVSFPPEGMASPVTHNSEQRLTPARMVSNAPQLLGQLEAQLRWLEDRLSSPPALAPLDDPRERARALLVVGEARDLAEKCRHAIQNDAAQSGAQAIPAPPKLPRM